MTPDAVASRAGVAGTSTGCTTRAFGVDLDTRFLFDHRLDRARGGPQLVFERSSRPAEEGGSSVDRDPRTGSAGLRLIPLDPRGHLLRFAHSVRFEIGDRRITYRLLDARHAQLLELRFLGPVMAFWLELQGLPALHASAAVLDGWALAFLSGNGGGKTSLAASLIQAGYPLLTDDVLAIEAPVVESPPRSAPTAKDAPAAAFLARPGYPQMRMWPRDAERFLGSAEGLERVHPRYSKLRVPVGDGGFGSFHHDSAPLGGVYLVERAGAGGSGEATAPRGHARIEPLPPHRALIELVRHSFTPRLVEAAGLQPRRLEVLARLVERVTVRRLVVPSGPLGLEAARDAVLADAARATEI